MASTAGFAVRSVPPPGHRPGPSERRSTRLVRWLAALGFGTAALALTLLLRAYLSGTVFVFFFFAITLTAWYSGLWPALVLSMLALIATEQAYVNVHTNDGVAPPNTGPGEFPGGELRGQLLHRGQH